MKNTLKSRALALLCSRQLFLIAATLGFLLTLPALNTGLWMDDYQQRIALLTNADINPFEFYRIGSEQTEIFLQRGILPWWTHPTTKLLFFRPVAHWLMQLDYAWWPNNFALMHLHSSIWYFALIVLAAVVYRRFTPTAIAAGVATLMFAIDAGHGGAVSWLANRNAMVAMMGSMLVLLCYQRESWHWLLIGSALFALTMACAEAALAITGYLFAYEVFLSERRLAIKIVRLAPYAIVAVSWLLFWHSRGYGSAGPGFYTDPASDPQAFVNALLYRAPSFLFGQFSIIPVEILGGFEETSSRTFVLLAVVLFCAIVAKILWPLLKVSPLARFYALGMCIALIPICGSQLVSRSLWYVSFGALGLLGLLIDNYFSAQEKRKKSVSVFVYAMLAMHLLVSPLLFVIDTQIGQMLDRYMDAKNLRLVKEGDAHQKILALSAYQFEANTYYPMFKEDAQSLGRTQTIAKLRLLTNGVGEFELMRVDSDTLIVRNEKGFEKMRAGRYGFTQGETVELDDVSIIVRRINTASAATEIEYRFHPGALDTYKIIGWDGNGFQPAHLPEKGSAMRVKVIASN